METDPEKQTDDKDKDDRPVPPTTDDEPAKTEAPDVGDDAPAEDAPSDEAKDSASPAPKRKKKKKKAASSPPVEPAQEPAKRAPPSTGMLVVGGLLVAALVGGGVYLLRRQGGSQGKWSVGQEADVEITIVPADSKNLACASADEIAGRHCAFEAQNKPWSKSTDADDKKILKPYTTTDRVQLAAAGLWSEPALSGGKLPAGRFSVKCKFKVEGNLKKPSIRWAAAGPWSDSPRDWYAGAVSGCVLVP
jgi:hypothetical protein